MKFTEIAYFRLWTYFIEFVKYLSFTDIVAFFKNSERLYENKRDACKAYTMWEPLAQLTKSFLECMGRIGNHGGILNVLVGFHF